MKKQRSFSVLGNIAIVNFLDNIKSGDKKKFANKILRESKAVTTVLEKSGNFKGRLRKMKTKHLAGEKTKEVLYKENGCVFRFNIDTTYFSPRLSNERKEVAGKIKKGENVLVMFAGVAPFSIVIAKNSKVAKVFSNEINREANKYAKLNVERNKLKDKIELVPGDIKRVVKKWRKESRFSSDCNKKIAHRNREGRLSEGNHRCPRTDVIIMPRPQLKDTFLKEAFKLSKKKTRIYYYDFCKVGEEDLVVEKIKAEAKKSKKKIKILKVKKAGEIAPYKIRVRVDFRII